MAMETIMNSHGPLDVLMMLAHFEAIMLENFEAAVETKMTKFTYKSNPS